MLDTKTVCYAWSEGDSRSYGETISCSYTTELKAGQTVFCKLRTGIIDLGSDNQFHGFRINWHDTKRPVLLISLINTECVFLFIIFSNKAIIISKRNFVGQIVAKVSKPMIRT